MRKALPPDVVGQLLGAIDRKSPFGERDYFMFVFALQTGLRISEWCGLRVGDVALNGVPRSSLHVSKEFAKFSKPRWVPLNAVARQAVADTLAFNVKRGFSVTPDAPLWVNRYHKPVGPRSIQYLVQALREKAGIPAPCVPHQLRHTYATRIVEAGGNLIDVKELLGHDTLDTVACYTSSSWGARQKATDALPQQ